MENTFSSLSNILYFLTKPRNQVILFFITSSLSLFGLYQYRKNFHSLEPFPELKPITAKKIAQWRGDPTLVKVGLHITNFPEFNVVDNKFTFDGIVWFEFDKALASLETIEKFSFEKGDIVSKSKPEVKILKDRVYAQYQVRVRFASNLSFDLFPLDDHRIFISIVNVAASPSEVIFDAYKPGFTLTKELFLPEWKIVATQVQSGYAEALLDTFDSKKVERDPKIIFSIDIVRSGNRQLVLILLPIFLIFFISLFALGLDPKENSSYIMGMTTACISSMIGYRFVTQNMTPDIGYFVLGDQIFTLLLALSFIQFLLGIVLIMKKGLTPGLIIARGSIFLLFHIAFLTVWFYLLFYWKG